MITNADMTLYSWTASGYIRVPIERVMWQESKQSSIEKTGLKDADAIKIFIPEASAPKGLAFALTKDIVVKGIIAFEFDNTTEVTRSASLKALHAAYDTHGVTVADGKLYGSPRMRHYQISCK